MAELADAPGSGPGGGKTPWRFESSHPHFYKASRHQGIEGKARGDSEEARICLYYRII